MKNYFISLTRSARTRLLIALGLLSIMICGGIAAEKTLSTRVTAADSSQLSFRSVSVSTGDTLWSVAKENYTQEWGSLSAYLDEIMRCNALTSEEITAGSSLIVPVYLPHDSADISLLPEKEREF